MFIPIYRTYLSEIKLTRGFGKGWAINKRPANAWGNHEAYMRHMGHGSSPANTSI